MAKIVFSTYQAKPNGSGRFSIVMNIGQTTPDPLPQKIVEVKTTDEALAAFEEYIAEAKATGQVAACSMRLKEGRKPNGFDAAKAKLPPYTIVNEDKAAA